MNILEKIRSAFGIRFAVSVTALSVVAHVAAAQDTASLRKDARVRLVAPGRYGRPNRVLEIGELQRLAGDTAVILRSDGKTLLRVAIDSNLTLEVSRNSRRHTAQGAFFGGVIGGAVGVAAPCEDSSSGFGAPSCDDLRPVVALLLAGAGALVGALVGNQIVSDDWQPVRLGVGMTPGLRSQVVVKLAIRR